MSNVALAEPATRVDDRPIAPATRKRIPRKRIAALLLAVGALGGGGMYAHEWWNNGRFLETTDDAYVGGDVTVIAPKVAGFISEVAVADNQRVKAHDLLIRLDDRDYKAALAKAEATYAAQEATLVNLDAVRHLQEAMVAQADADVASTDAERARSRFDVDRYRELAASKYASEQRFQQADAENKKAVAGALKARAAVDAARRQLDVIDTQKAQARAARDQAAADRDIARLNLGYTEIRAPIDGVIGNRSARLGAYATVGAGLIALVPATGLWVDANFKESQVATMRAGQRVTIVADVLPDTTLSGRVTSLAPATGAQFSILPAENATGNFTKIVQRVPVRIALDGDARSVGLLRPGLSVTAAVDLRDANALPARR